MQLASMLWKIDLILGGIVVVFSIIITIPINYIIFITIITIVIIIGMSLWGGSRQLHAKVAKA